MALSILFSVVEGEIINVINAYIPTYAQDIVAVYDSQSNQLFADARPTKVDVKERAKVLEHPTESGGTVTDWRVIQPIEIDMAMTLIPTTYADTYNQIKSVYMGVNLVTVQTNTGTYPNMMISDIPHIEDAAHFDTIVMQLKFKEARIVTISTSPLPASATTQNGGNINPKPASAATIANSRTDATDNGTAAQGIVKFFGGG